MMRTANQCIFWWYHEGLQYKASFSRTLLRGFGDNPAFSHYLVLAKWDSTLRLLRLEEAMDVKTMTYAYIP
jgi:hypothetical protein